ncbi:hypothetical protein BsWGS_28939 [Bradybaena similaris]
MQITPSRSSARSAEWTGCWHFEFDTGFLVLPGDVELCSAGRLVSVLEKMRLMDVAIARSATEKCWMTP